MSYFFTKKAKKEEIEQEVNTRLIRNEAMYVKNVTILKFIRFLQLHALGITYTIKNGINT